MDETLFRFANSFYLTAPGFWAVLDGSTAVLVLGIAAAVLAWFTGEKRWILPAVVAVGLTDLVAVRAIKPAVNEPRPCTILEGVHGPGDWRHPDCGAGPAMPSAHAANTMALAVAIGSPPLMAVSLLVGVSRVVTGQHWPSDVAAGWALGAAVALAVREGAKKAFRWP